VDLLFTDERKTVLPEQKKIMREEISAEEISANRGQIF